MEIHGVFYSSSACMYPAYNQENPDDFTCEESTAYPAAPDSEYGWEKLFSERLYLAYNRNYGMENKIARYHNIFGPYGTFDGGKEKAPAAICRKVATNDKEIEIWGDGTSLDRFSILTSASSSLSCSTASSMSMNSLSTSALLRQ